MSSPSSCPCRFSRYDLVDEQKKRIAFADSQGADDMLSFPHSPRFFVHYAPAPDNKWVCSECNHFVMVHATNTDGPPCAALGPTSTAAVTAAANVAKMNSSNSNSNDDGQNYESYVGSDDDALQKHQQQVQEQAAALYRQAVPPFLQVRQKQEEQVRDLAPCASLEEAFALPTSGHAWQGTVENRLTPATFKDGGADYKPAVLAVRVSTVEQHMYHMSISQQDIRISLEPNNRDFASTVNNSDYQSALRSCLVIARDNSWHAGGGGGFFDPFEAASSSAADGEDGGNHKRITVHLRGEPATTLAAKKAALQEVANLVAGGDLQRVNAALPQSLRIF